MPAADTSPNEQLEEPSEDNAVKEAHPRKVRIPAALSPADAADLRDRLSEALHAAGPHGIALELEDGPPMPCALQLLVATERSAEALGLPCVLGPTAESVRATLTLDQPQE